ncbi:hypothetical protein AAFN88_21205 [Pelagibius sp. CAU 1746]|uniref:hypothetical protein n=1 Tax=Pelagibius sp. CAU 1746 TaxID=3140370 RepID=UPI00325ACAFF
MTGGRRCGSPLGRRVASELTVAAGALTVTGGHHSVDTEADAAADDLDTLDMTVLAEGDIVELKAETAARVVTLKHGVGNVTL